MPSSAHKAKRPYAGSQPSITNYFSPSSSSSAALSSQPATSPAIPHSVQSSLLSVGMRVRKSVPEGYKTDSFSIFSDPATIPSSKPSWDTDTEHRGTRVCAGMRELTPWCGLMKTGGLGVQGEGEVILDIYGNEERGWYGSSQSSTQSYESAGSYGAGNGAKRRFEDEEEDNWDEDRGVLMDTAIEGRRIAMPRPRNVEKGNIGEKQSMRIGTEARTGGDGNADMDFEEAEFLDYGLVGQGEEEVHMGGV